MVVLQWPFDPDHITADRNDRLGGLGILPNEYLQGLITAIAGRLKYPVTVVEFRLKPTTRAGNSDDCLTTVFHSIDDHSHQPCAVFKEQVQNREKCEQIDRCYASLFHGLNTENLESELRKRLTTDPHIQKESYGRNLLMDIDKKGRFIVFQCPLLPYIRLAFPILFGGRVIAVFLIGEIILDGRKREEEEGFKYAKEHFGAITKRVCKAHNERANMTSRSSGEFRKLIVDAFKEVKKLERVCRVKVEDIRKAYIENELRKCNRDLYDDLSTKIGQSESKVDQLNTLWTIVGDYMKKIRSAFAFDFICLFGTKHFSDRTVSVLPLVSRAGHVPVPLGKGLGSVEFNLESIPCEARTKPIISPDVPEVFEGLSFGNTLDQHMNFIRTFPAGFSPNSIIITWAGYSRNWNPLMRREHKASGRALERAIRQFYAIVTSAHSAILSEIAKGELTDTMKVFKHEIGQQSAGLDSLRKLHLLHPDVIRNLSENKAMDVIRGVEAFRSQIQFISVQAGMRITIPDAKPVLFPAVGRLLHKMRETHFLEANKKSLELVVPEARKDDPMRPYLFGDPVLLEQLMYNLVNNSWKYCFRGTRIHLDSKRVEDDAINPYVLSVTDFGLPLDESLSDGSWELYKRGKNVTEEGVGIGMYIVKQIVEKHQGDLKAESTLICAYNVPLIEHYIHTQFKGKDQKLVATLQAELERLIRAGTYDLVVAQHYAGKPRYTSPTRYTLQNEIRRPTAKVTFFVAIPPQGGSSCKSYFSKTVAQ